jgi:serine/threonine protein kinase/tetratricopeptide (TPR) repeat protein
MIAVEPEREDSEVATKAMPHVSPLPRGSILAGRYEVGEVLGVGGMGAVHAALDRALGERVALKVLSRGGEGHSDRIERFRREVRTARRVTHRNAVRTFDIGEHEGLYFLTMELVEGESLAALLRREGPLGGERLLDVARQVCDGLGAVHEAGLVHRDLKPSNVLMGGSGRVVLTDFGVARSSMADDLLTHDGGVVGTPHYMAPEQLVGGAITTQTDVYALGLLLYEAATGRRPFERGDALVSATARLLQEPEPLPRDAGLPAWVEPVIMACLRREPAQRPRSVLEVRGLMVPPRSVDLAETRVEPGGEETLTSSGPADTQVPGATPAPFERGLAVLPLRYRGPAAEAYLADAMTEQLVDVLSMTRGLRVPAVGATQRYAEDRDPRSVGEALKVDVVLDGTVQRAGSQVRVAVRLLDTSTGFQRWSDHVDGELRDVFDLQDRIAMRVVETLRLRLELERYQGALPPEAIETYLRARLRMQSFFMGGPGPDGAFALLERCLELAPSFPAAWAAQATVCARLWFFLGGLEWGARGDAAMTRALELGPNLPDTQLGAARMLAESGRFAPAIQALRRALELAPTHAAAHGFLGMLQCEAGRAAEGIAHIELAVELDPANLAGLYVVGRHAALHGDLERCTRLLEHLWSRDHDTRFAAILLELRIAMWSLDVERIRRWRDELVDSNHHRSELPVAMADHALGEQDDPSVLLGILEDSSPRETSSPRFRAVQEQLVIEALLVRGRVDEALPLLERLAEGPLIDVEWLERCPLLGRITDRARMWQVQRRVRERVQELWALG